MQRNWIGRSEGAEFELAGRTGRDDVAASGVFTTRPDTSFGMTYVVLAPEHPLVAEITTDEHRAAVEAFVERVQHASPTSSASRPRAPLEKRGVFTGALRRQPVQRASRCRSTSPTTC